MNREELAWAAGFFDGEGHVGLNHGTRTGNKHIRIEVSQKEIEPLERFRRAVGGLGQIYLVKRKKGNPYYNWHTGKFETVQAVIAMLWNWMSPRRKMAAKNALLVLWKQRQEV